MEKEMSERCRHLHGEIWMEPIWFDNGFARAQSITGDARGLTMSRDAWDRLPMATLAAIRALTPEAIIKEAPDA
jgi:hypothetical protein